MDGAASFFDQVLSDDDIYEYRADRWWGKGPRLAFVGCNPSLITWQAGARLDPTSANCEAIARRDGYHGVTMLNLWARLTPGVTLGPMSDAARHSHGTAHGTVLLPADLTPDQLASAPVLASLDALLVEDLTDDEDDAFAAALDA